MEFCLRKIPHDTGRYSLSIYTSVASSNDTVKSMAAAGAPSGTVVLADRQTAGRGRQGRSFCSPDGGFYMSLLLRPPALSQNAGMLTIHTAALTSALLEEMTGLPIGIKWVNDLYTGSYKICGILAEASTDTLGRPFAVLGIGINLSAESFPSSAGNAGSIRMAGGIVPDKNDLASKLLARLEGLSDSGLAPYLLAEYRRRNILPGQSIKIVGGDGQRLLAVSIDDEGGLVVMDSNRNLHTLRYGEVSTVLDSVPNE